MKKTDPQMASAALPRWRGIFCNRTLNLRAIKAIGYDMDYTLIHYHVAAWEQRAFEYAVQKVVAAGWPVADVSFEPGAIIRGLVIDRELGNVVKTNRFGYVKAASHGTRPMGWEETRAVYARTVVDLSESRFHFLNTLFGLSEAQLYMHLVDALDKGDLPRRFQTMGYARVHSSVRRSIDLAHMEGQLKADIRADPDRYVDLDPDVPLALLDQRRAGKKVLLITNSGMPYTAAMMSYAFDRFLPGAMTWRDCFDLTIVSSRKPTFFEATPPVFEVLDDQGTCRPHQGPLKLGGIYLGGHAGLVEQSLGLNGEQILYVGDHVYGDVTVSKSVRRWRTGLVLRELEAEIEALDAFQPQQEALEGLMERKRALEFEYSRARVERQRLRQGYGPIPQRTAAQLEAFMGAARDRLVGLDQAISPLARASGELANPRWGLLLRTGTDKSHMARHVERHADVYTSRVSNFLYETPFQYLRSSRGALPHDP